MSSQSRFFLALILFVVVMFGAYRLLISTDKGERDISVEQVMDSFDPESPEGQALARIEEQIVPRRVSEFAMDHRIMAVRYPAASNVLMGRMDLDYTHAEVLNIVCDLKSVGYEDLGYEFVLTVEDEDDAGDLLLRDVIGVRLEKETVADLNCADTASVRLPDIADNYSLLYLENAVDTAQ